VKSLPLKRGEPTGTTNGAAATPDFCKRDACELGFEAVSVFGVFRLSCGRWHRRPSPGGVRLTVSRSLTEAQRRRGGLGEEEG